MNYRLALLTGATGGLGKELAFALAKRKVPLFLTATKQEALRDLTEYLQPETNVEYFAADLSLPSSRDELLNIVRKRAPDLVINNAGFGLYGECLAHPTSDQLKIAEVDAMAVMEITLEAARALASQKSPGTILNVSSLAGFFPMPYHASYCASKAFVNQFSCAFAREVEHLSIRVLVSCPGQIDTPFRLRASNGKAIKKEGHNIDPKKAAEEILRQIEHGPTLRIIDRFYRVLSGIARLLPRSLIEKQLARTLKRRVTPVKV